MIGFSKKARSLNSSSTAKVYEEVARLRAIGQDIIDLSVGQPHFDFSKKAKEMAAEIIGGEGNNRYAPNIGLIELRRAIADRHSIGVDGVFISAGGAKQAIHLLLETLIDPGDSVVVFSPYWTSYPELISLAGGQTKPFVFWDGFNSSMFNGFVRGSGAKVVILNNPVNPTGAVWSLEELEALGRIAIDNDLVVISDEVYDRFIYDDFKFISLAKMFPSERGRFITVNSFSKTYAMMGYRIGYVLADKGIALKLADLQSQVSSGANTFGQRLALAVMNHCQQESSFMVAEFAENRSLVRSIFQKENIRTAPFNGAFYALVNIGHLSDDLPFWQRAVQNGVGVVDGSQFGAPGYVRICYAQPRRVLDKGLKRLVSTIRSIS